MILLVVQAVLELTTILLLILQSAGITGTHHNVQPVSLFHIPTNNACFFSNPCQYTLFATFLRIVLLCFVIINHPSICKVLSHCGFVCHTGTDVEHLFILSALYSRSSLECSRPWSVLLLLNCRSPLRVLYNLLSNICFEIYQIYAFHILNNVL